MYRNFSVKQNDNKTRLRP